MQHITIHNLGPIDYCELDISQFMVLTGPQASGKSTVAKCIFFFKNMKSLIYSQMQKQQLLREVGDDGVVQNLPLKFRVFKEIRSNFLQTFGTTWCMDENMCISCIYAEGVSVSISLRDATTDAPNYIWVDLSDKINDFIAAADSQSPISRRDDVIGVDDVMKERDGARTNERASEQTSEWMNRKKAQIDNLFDDHEEVVYIPAGRSMITLLSSQINYIYSTMDDIQRRNLDYCTQNYLERILRIKSKFSHSADQQIEDAIYLTDRKVNRGLLKDATSLMKKILHGDYCVKDGEERLQISPSHYVKINFASSGQQEVLWILNVLFYQLLYGDKSCFIIEEPESHLFPNAQKLIAEFIALSRNHGANSVILTTHSPYILGTLNNLLFANKIAPDVENEQLDKLVQRDRWLEFDNFSAFFLEDGKLTPCVDKEFESIENEVIDGASSDINGEYEAMLALLDEGKRVKD